MRNIWRNGNHLILLPEGKRYIPEMLAAIDDANDSVLFEQYLTESGHLAERFIYALAQAAARGVHVQVLLEGYV